MSDRSANFEDEILVLRAQQGEPEAFENLLVRWQERLWHHAVRLIGDDDAAWDALQETFIAISRGIPRLESPTSFPGWAYSIVTNKCRDYVRRQSRQQARENEWLERFEREQLDRDDNRQQWSTIAEALDSVPGPDRAILSLFYMESFSVSQIAAILEVPKGTVKSRLYKARNRLRQTLEEKNHE